MKNSELLRFAAAELGFADIALIHADNVSELSNIAVLLFPYSPYSPQSLVSAYYIASNRAYHATKELARRLCDAGSRFVPNQTLPQRQLAQSAGLGLIGKNGLLHTERFGSYVVLQTANTDIEPEPLRGQLPKNICASCNLCVSACPMKAIDKRFGVNAEGCMRAHMERAPYPNEVVLQLRTYLGCELCMRACPYNAAIQGTRISREIETAFSPSRVLAGSAREDAKRYFGSNIRYSRLVFEAGVFASRAEADACLADEDGQE